MAAATESNNGGGSLHSLHAALDPKSLILSQFSDSTSPQFLQLTTESPILERGPRYNEYSDLRNKRLRSRISTDEKVPCPIVLTPPRKQVKFSSPNLATTPPRQVKRTLSSSSVVAQSVPDFSALRKENRRPPVTPPPAVLKSGKMYGKLGGAGSKSANAGEKRGGGGMMTTMRKSYANVEEMKSLSVAAKNAIINGGRLGLGNGGASSNKTILGSRRF